MLRPLHFRWFSYQEVHPVTLSSAWSFRYLHREPFGVPFGLQLGLWLLEECFPSMPEDLDSVLNAEAERVLGKSVKS